MKKRLDLIKRIAERDRWYELDSDDSEYIPELIEDGYKEQLHYSIDIVLTHDEYELIKNIFNSKTNRISVERYLMSKNTAVDYWKEINNV